jgi:hypothetical protein
MLPLVRSLHVAALLAVLAGSGCGGGGPSDEQQVRAAVVAFSQATVAKDYDKLCKQLLAPALVEKVKDAGLPCEVALEKGLGGVRDPKLSIGAIKVDGDRATAQVHTSAAGEPPSKDTLQLTKVNGQWRIASLA